MRMFAAVNSRAMLALFSIGLLLSGCGTFGNEDPGSVLSTGETVELGAATSVSAKIDVNTQASLTVHDGASSLLDAQFSYNEKLEPDVSYSVEGSRGTLEVSQPRRGNLDYNKLENEWDLQFGSDAPVDLAIDMSSGNTKVDVSTMALASLDVDTSSGNLDASIGGNQDQLQRIVARSSSGGMALNLDATFPALETIELDESSGNVDLALSGDFQALQRISIESSSGNTRLEVAGSWARDLDTTIDTSSGNVTLVVPTGVGVRITADVSSGNVNADGFRIDGGAYVNDAYGTSDVTLQFEIDVSSGNIDLSLAG